MPVSYTHLDVYKRQTLLLSAAVAILNAVVGTVIAWVLARDEFPGKRIVDALIDLPFARCV